MVAKSSLFGKHCRINPLVFSSATFPTGIRMSEVEIRPQGAGDRLMVGNSVPLSAVKVSTRSFIGAGFLTSAAPMARAIGWRISHTAPPGL